MIVGLTGGICSGKSLASSTLESAGVHVVDCDEIARYLTTCDPQVRYEIRQSFGADVFHPNGALLRAALGKLVFAAVAPRKALEAILHPRILSVVDSNITAARQQNFHLVVVVPLLFELELDGLFDQTWLVHCEPEQQLARLMQRSGMNSSDARQWIAAQLPADVKIPRATRVLLNNAKIEDFKQLVLNCWEGARS